MQYDELREAYDKLRQDYLLQGEEMEKLQQDCDIYSSEKTFLNGIKVTKKRKQAYDNFVMAWQRREKKIMEFGKIKSEDISYDNFVELGFSEQMTWKSNFEDNVEGNLVYMNLIGNLFFAVRISPDFDQLSQR